MDEEIALRTTPPPRHHLRRNDGVRSVTYVLSLVFRTIALLALVATLLAPLLVHRYLHNHGIYHSNIPVLVFAYLSVGALLFAAIGFGLAMLCKIFDSVEVLEELELR